MSLKPAASLLSLYWSHLVAQRSDRLRPNIVWSTILGHLPFVLVFWWHDIWFLIFASTIYMTFHRGATPAWMEVLKLHTSEQERKKIFAYGSAIYHLGGALLALCFGMILDRVAFSWSWLFPASAALAMSAALLQHRLPRGTETRPTSNTTLNLHLTKPWREAVALLKRRPDFAWFQLGFMLGGGGLMLWASILVPFLVDVLHLNYKELSSATSLCKHLGYGVALPLWTRAMGRTHLFSFTSLVTGLAMFFPLFLLAGESHLVWVYFAYFLYGAMQPGSELSWNLSGPLFAKEEESSLYSAINVITVGLRGLLLPGLGTLLAAWIGITPVLLMGGAMCFAATLVLSFWPKFAFKPEQNPPQPS